MSGAAEKKSGPGVVVESVSGRETSETGQAAGGAAQPMSNRVKGLVAMGCNIVSAVLIIPFNKWLFKNLAFKWVSERVFPFVGRLFSLPLCRCWRCRCCTTA